jgi:hypothetical protein
MWIGTEFKVPMQVINEKEEKEYPLAEGRLR